MPDGSGTAAKAGRRAGRRGTAVSPGLFLYGGVFSEAGIEKRAFRAEARKARVVRCPECRTGGGEKEGVPELCRWEYRCGAVNVAAEAGWLKACIPFTAVWRVCFEKAAVIYDGEHVTAYPYGGEPVAFDTEEKVKIPTGINVPPTGWYLRELGHFLDCLKRDQDSPLVPRERVLAVLELLERTI